MDMLLGQYSTSFWQMQSFLCQMQEIATGDLAMTMGIFVIVGANFVRLREGH